MRVLRRYVPAVPLALGRHCGYVSESHVPGFPTRNIRVLSYKGAVNGAGGDPRAIRPEELLSASEQMVKRLHLFSTEGGVTVTSCFAASSYAIR